MDGMWNFLSDFQPVGPKFVETLAQGKCPFLGKFWGTQMGGYPEKAVVPQILPHIYSIYRWYMLVYISEVLSQGYSTFPFENGALGFQVFMTISSYKETQVVKSG